ncbi:MAG: hypothetical protein ACK4UQ_08315 [Brevundimonas sp.]
MNEADAARLSFPDREIIRFAVNAQGLAFTIDGVFVDGLGLLESPCEVELITGAKITARTYDGDSWAVAEEPFVGLRDVCEWAVDGRDLKVSGFSAGSGAWTEIVVPRFSAIITAG